MDRKPSGAILRAATKVFARNGYFNSKVADIARAAEVADGTVYLTSKAKEEILHSIFDHVNMADAIKSGRELIKDTLDPREQPAASRDYTCNGWGGPRSGRCLSGGITRLD